MDPVDEFARLKDDIRNLQDRVDHLRAGFLQPGARLRSNQFEVQVRRQKRMVFNRDRLPPDILTNPDYWDLRESEVVTCRPLSPAGGDDEDIVLIE